MTTLNNDAHDKRPVGRPSKVAELVPRRSLDDRAKMANKFHQAAGAAYAQACHYAVLCGLELLAARELVHHGEWEEWINKNCEFTRMTAHRYMTLAEKSLPVLRKEYPELVSKTAMAAPSLMKAEARMRLIEAVSRMTDGHTIQELQLELGIIRPKPDPVMGGAREGAGRPTKLSKQVVDQLTAMRDWDEFSRPMCKWFADKRFNYLDEKQRQHVRDVMAGAMALLEGKV